MDLMPRMPQRERFLREQLTEATSQLKEQEDLARDAQELADFLRKELAKRDAQLDRVIAAGKKEVKVHRDIIDFLLSLYTMKDPRMQVFKEINVRFALANADEAVAMPHGDGSK